MTPHESLPVEHLHTVSGFGGHSPVASYAYRPQHADEIDALFALARSTGRSIVFRGAGRSYGDAAVNAENIVVDICDLNSVREWNPETGRIVVEPGVTIQQLWEAVLPDGWWPPVVPGTMFSTIAGCAAMNVHGKNNFIAGTFGDHVEEFEFATPSGGIQTVSRASDPAFFRAALGSLGMLGFFRSITMRMKRVYSGLLDVVGVSTPSLRTMMEEFESRQDGADYLVGWVDAFAAGVHQGRGVLHAARHLSEGDDPVAETTLSVASQALPDRLFGILPKSSLWRLMRPLLNNAGVRLINLARYSSGRLFDAGGRSFRQSHAAFAFLLDYVPDWRRAYGPGGLIQYQSFVPRAIACNVFSAQMHYARRMGLPAFLSVLKRHRPDDYLLSHALDGYSLAMDFKVTRSNRENLWKMAAAFDAMVLDARGRFYFAKDSTMLPSTARAFLGSEVVETFRRLKRQCDPDNLLQSNLSRRLFLHAV